MAHTASALKRIKQSEKRRMANKSQKSAMKTYIKKYLVALENNDSEAATSTLKDAVKIINKTASKGVIHKKQASRRISRLTLKLNALSK